MHPVTARRLPARQPAVVPAPADPEGQAGGHHGQTGLHGFEDFGAAGWCAARVRVTMDHRGALRRLRVSSLLNLAGQGSPCVTNLAGEQS